MSVDKNKELIEKFQNNFIKNIIEDDLQNKKHDSIVTRFPPEPNGLLHIGHTKSICFNFSVAKFYGGKCHLRFDDTNPEKESQEYVEAIKEDIQWLGFDWGDCLFFASDYFDQLYDMAHELISLGKAYVDDLSPEEIRKYRGTLKEAGKNSPFRDRSVEESRDLFKRMREGEFEEGSRCLRAKIDMSSPNINMRDPVIYRIKKVAHHRSGEKWPIYPMYDFTHGLSDMLEKVTHSLCTLEFQDHRPLYDWFLETLQTPCHPQQIEFAKLNLEYVLLSKRNLLRMINEKIVDGWDDPRLLTIKGMRRRGYTPEGIRFFCDSIGMTKKESSIEMGTLEYSIRQDLEMRCPRAFCVVDPLKVVITNWEEGKTQNITCAYHPQDESFGKRDVPMTREIYIERDDFMEDAPSKFFRLKAQGYVRLKFSYVIYCDEVIKDENGEVVELHCRYFPETFAGKKPEGFPKVKGIINWVSASEGVKIENRLYDRLFTVPNPGKDVERALSEWLNPKSLEVKSSVVEPALSKAKIGDRFQFERQGYFIKDSDSDDRLSVWNRIVTLKDVWAKKDKK